MKINIEKDYPSREGYVELWMDEFIEPCGFDKGDTFTVSIPDKSIVLTYNPNLTGDKRLAKCGNRLAIRLNKSDFHFPVALGTHEAEWVVESDSLIIPIPDSMTKSKGFGLMEKVVGFLKMKGAAK